MTRNEIIEYYTHLLKRGAKDLQVIDDSFVKDSLTDLFESVLRELKQPQPDPETGLMPCGCGGKAELCPVNDYYTARCERCRTTSDYYKTAGETIAAWNRAAGGIK